MMRRIIIKHVKKTIMGALLLLPSALLQAAEITGQTLTLDENRGNCLLCHQIAGSSNGGTLGPELRDIRHKYPDRKLLQQMLWDASSLNSHTIMPPYGRFRLLSTDEIDKIIDFLYKL